MMIDFKYILNVVTTELHNSQTGSINSNTAYGLQCETPARGPCQTVNSLTVITLTHWHGLHHPLWGLFLIPSVKLPHSFFNDILKMTKQRPMSSVVFDEGLLLIFKCTQYLKNDQTIPRMLFNTQIRNSELHLNCKHEVNDRWNTATSALVY